MPKTTSATVDSTRTASTSVPGRRRTPPATIRATRGEPTAGRAGAEVVTGGSPTSERGTSAERSEALREFAHRLRQPRAESQQQQGIGMEHALRLACGREGD